MIVGRILAPVHSLGPGERLCLWTRGCGKRCENCVSPELQDMYGADTDEKALARAICSAAKKCGCTGLTVSGGDPMEQAPALLRLLRLVRGSFDDILVYTGYTMEELRSGAAGAEGMECLALIDVLIDGRYVRELNTPDCVLRGSLNQRLHFLSADKKPVYEEYMKRGRILESFVHGSDTIITGILNEVI